MVLMAEAAFGFVGGIIAVLSNSPEAASHTNHFWPFCLWSTFIISGGMFLLNILNTYQDLHAKFVFLVFVELGYVAVWALFYVIAAIISFVPGWWSMPAIIGYVELALFLLDGFFHFQGYRTKGAENLPPAATHDSFSIEDSFY